MIVATCLYLCMYWPMIERVVDGGQLLVKPKNEESSRPRPNGNDWRLLHQRGVTCNGENGSCKGGCARGKAGGGMRIVRFGQGKFWPEEVVFGQVGCWLKEARSQVVA